MTDAHLWAITCYFNPVGYKSRLANYRAFRSRLAVPLVTVELSFENGFRLRRGDADILVQLHGESLMWQKERLLNVAIRHLPPTCECVAWLDCDVVFERADWPRRARLALEQYSLLRLFHKRHDLAPDMPIDWLVPQEIDDRFEGVARFEKIRSPGLAWACRHELIERHGLYDACVVGSGDRAILYAALGLFDEAARILCMSGRRLEHYLAWAEPFHASVQGRVGYIHGRLFHLWHGERTERGYGERRQHLLEECDFDPDHDIGVDSNGCWRWISEKHNLHEAVRRYFLSRNEDGQVPAIEQLSETKG